MNLLQMFGALLVQIADRQHWVNSDKFGGALHVLVPLAEGTILHAMVLPSGGGDAPPAVIVSQHADAASAVQAVEAAAMTGLSGVLENAVAHSAAAASATAITNTPIVPEGTPGISYDNTPDRVDRGAP